MWAGWSGYSTDGGILLDNYSLYLTLITYWRVSAPNVLVVYVLRTGTVHHHLVS
jgi:hypothetical protein